MGDIKTIYRLLVQKDSLLKDWYLDHIVDLRQVTVRVAVLVQSPQQDGDALPSSLLIPL